MRYQLRIIAGALRGRKLSVTLDPKLRPMADRVRQALFSIWGDAIPDRPFVDIFGGSGAVGFEAVSRGAKSVIFIELDSRSIAELQRHAEAFGVKPQVHTVRADAYGWVDRWKPPAEPINVFIGPPYEEFEKHWDAVAWMTMALQEKLADGSVLVLQSDRRFDADLLPKASEWDVRAYGRTQLGIWKKP